MYEMILVTDRDGVYVSAVSHPKDPGLNEDETRDALIGVSVNGAQTFLEGKGYKKDEQYSVKGQLRFTKQQAFAIVLGFGVNSFVYYFNRVDGTKEDPALVREQMFDLVMHKTIKLAEAALEEHGYFKVSGWVGKINEVKFVKKTA